MRERFFVKEKCLVALLYRLVEEKTGIQEHAKFIIDPRKYHPLCDIFRGNWMECDVVLQNGFGATLLSE